VATLVASAIAGLVFGAVAVAIMVPMQFADKPAAMAAAFVNRFAIGFLIGVVALPGPGWAVGLGLGLLLSVPDALVTKAYAPILGLGAVGGAVIGFVLGRAR
jgi:hypothetical protein